MQHIVAGTACTVSLQHTIQHFIHFFFFKVPVSGCFISRNQYWIHLATLFINNKNLPKSQGTLLSVVKLFSGVRMYFPVLKRCISVFHIYLPLFFFKALYTLEHVGKVLLNVVFIDKSSCLTQFMMHMVFQDKSEFALFRFLRSQKIFVSKLMGHTKLCYLRVGSQTGPLYVQSLCSCSGIFHMVLCGGFGVKVGQ